MTLRAQLRYLTDQARLLAAEYLIHAAVVMAPRGHPDTTAILVAAHHVFSRRPR